MARAYQVPASNQRVEQVWPALEIFPVPLPLPLPLPAMRLRHIPCMPQYLDVLFSEVTNFGVIVDPKNRIRARLIMIRTAMGNRLIIA